MEGCNRELVKTALINFRQVKVMTVILLVYGWKIFRSQNSIFYDLYLEVCVENTHKNSLQMFTLFLLRKRVLMGRVQYVIFCLPFIQNLEPNYWRL